MSEKTGYPDGPPPNEPPPSYSPPYPAAGGMANQAFTAPQYAPQQYGLSPTQYSLSNVVVTQPGICNQPVRDYVPDNMGLAIFVTICCFWPLGIVAIMRASEARAAINRGDMQNASLYSSQARRYSMWALACGIVSLVLAIVIVVVVVVTFNSNDYCYPYCY